MHYRYYSTKLQVFQENLAPRRVFGLILCGARKKRDRHSQGVTIFFSGAYRGSGILPVRRYTKRLVQTSKSDKSNNPNGKQVGESAARGRFVQSVPWTSMIAVLLRATQDTRRARMRTPAHTKPKSIQTSVKIPRKQTGGAFCFMCAEFEIVRSTQKKR